MLPFRFYRNFSNRACPDEDKARITFWEAMFILLASARALEEYTASMEHGWYSERNLLLVSLLPNDNRPR
jgi:hypothetical protein